jgi:hypothetical protein
VADLLPSMPGFAPGSFHVGTVVDRVALGQNVLRILRFSSAIVIPSSLSTLIYHLGDEEKSVRGRSSET